MPEWIVALIGVSIGFLLNEGYSAYKNKKCIEELTAALLDELDTNFHQLDQKIAISQKIYEAIKGGGFLSGLSVPFATAVYDNYLQDILPTLTPIQRDNIRHIELTACNAFERKGIHH